MAALIRHGLLGNPLIRSTAILAVNTASLRHDITRSKSKKAKKPKKVSPSFNDDTASLATKGFLRYQKVYNPPEDVFDRINKICEEQNILTDDQTKITDPIQRFQLFMACEKELEHSLTNSTLYSIETIGDLKNYYNTPVGSVTPLDEMKNMELPKNLHINYEYTRFHPDTDTKFGGKTAFPESSTLVTGLKYRSKYPGHKQKDPYLEKLLQQ